MSGARSLVPALDKRSEILLSAGAGLEPRPSLDDGA
jgi:hypothetical protein